MAGGWGAGKANQVLQLLLAAVAIANVADNASSSPTTNTYASLHTASPSGSNQTTNEAAYPSYARAAIVRTGSGWDFAGAVATLHALLSWTTSTGSPSETHTHVGFGTAISGTGSLIFWGTLTPNITMNAAGITPQLTTATTITLAT